MYGRSATGKTTLACTFPKKLLLIDIKDFGDDSVEGVKGVDVLDVSSWEQFESYYWLLKKNPNLYSTVVIDTMTQLQQLAILKVMTDKKKDIKKSLGDFGTMTQREWGQVSSMMKIWITHFRDLPLNVVFIAQDRVFNATEEDESMLDPEVGPALSPSISKHLNASVNFIGNTYIKRSLIPKKFKKGDKIIERKVEKIDFCIRVGHNPVYITKVRKPQEIELPEEILNPTYKEIIELLKGKES